MKKVRGKSSIYMAVVLMFLVTSIVPVIVNTGYANGTPKMFLDPSDPVANPTEFFTVNLTVENAPNIEAWEAKLTWDISILKFPTGVGEAAAMIKEGPFLNDTHPHTEFVVTAPNLVERTVLFGCYMTHPTPPNGASGNGTLASITFEVIESGACDIEIVDAVLSKYNGTGDLYPPTDLVIQGASFISTKPYVDFYWTPVSPEVNEACTFNASACFDPGGSNDNITLYTWDFGDGNETSTSSPVIVHKFGAYNDAGWVVNLTCTDDDAEEWFKVQSLRMWHDVLAVDIWPTVDYLDGTAWNVDWLHSGANEDVMGWPYPTTQVWFLVTGTNLGTYTETFNLTLYADLDTGVIGDEYVINWRYPFFGAWIEDSPYETITLGPQTGSGWWPFFAADMVGWPEGNYTLTAMASTVPGETDTANNVFTAPFLFEVTAIPSWLSGDANMDGVVNILDMVLAALYFGRTSSEWLAGNFDARADIKQDGIVNILDLVVIGINWGKTFP
jgi:hypothetical protein